MLTLFSRTAASTRIHTIQKYNEASGNQPSIATLKFTHCRLSSGVWFAQRRLSTGWHWLHGIQKTPVLPLFF
jgi:hypothetical protein